MNARSLLALLAVCAALGALGSCGRPAAFSVPASPTASAVVSPPPSPSPSPSRSPVSPAASATPSQAAVPRLFMPFGAYTFHPVRQDLIQRFEAAANASVRGSGRVGDVVGAEARRAGRPPVTVFAFTLLPEAGRTEQELLAKVLEATAGARDARWEPGLGGQAFVLETATTTDVVTIWAEEPFPLFLYASGARNTPVSEVVRGLLRQR